MVRAFQNLRISELLRLLPRLLLLLVFGLLLWELLPVAALKMSLRLYAFDAVGWPTQNKLYEEYRDNNFFISVFFDGWRIRIHRRVVPVLCGNAFLDPESIGKLHEFL